MAELTALYWDKRYQNNDFGWDTGSITTPLREYIEQLSDKNLKILIPGAGNAYEAEFLFNHGFYNIFVLDFATIPLQNLKARFPLFPESHLIQQDFFEHHQQYDLIIEQTFFCALHPSLRPAYAKHMHQLLKPKGKLVGVLFDDELNIDQPPFEGSMEEYEELFKPYFKFRTFESCRNSIKPRAGRELFMILEKK